MNNFYGCWIDVVANWSDANQSISLTTLDTKFYLIHEKSVCVYSIQFKKILFGSHSNSTETPQIKILRFWFLLFYTDMGWENGEKKNTFPNFTTRHARIHEESTLNEWWIERKGRRRRRRLFCLRKTYGSKFARWCTVAKADWSIVCNVYCTTNRTRVERIWIGI